MAARIAIQADGAYVVDDDGREIKLPGGAVVNPNGSVTIRVSDDDVDVRAPIEVFRCYDMNGNTARKLRILAALVTRGYLTLEQIAAVRPGVAAVLQSQGVTNGTYNQ